ncbi:MAG TPA: DUF1177 domain-containing protein [Acidimicrobiia bacterium]|jgi:hypothetical protein
MTLSQVLAALDLLDAPVQGPAVASELVECGLEVEVHHVEGEDRSTDFLIVTVPGSRGRRSGGDAPTLGIVGRLGGIGARPEVVGMVSDGDGAVVAVAAAMKLARMVSVGDMLPGDVAIATHVCPEAPTIPHDPVPFMGPPVPMETMNRWEVRPEMEAVLSVDTTKGNKILNWKGIAITPTVLAGWILPVAPDLVEVYEHVCGVPARVLPLSAYDVTPYGNDLHHVNSIMQPAVATSSPVVGVAVTTETVVPGTASGANHPVDLALAVSFCIEVAKRFGAGTLRFYDAAGHVEALRRYGPLDRLQTLGEG